MAETVQFNLEQMISELKDLEKKVIQAHPDKPTFYALATTWEFETNSNIISTRALMQRGSRMISTSIELWKECFKLDLSSYKNNHNNNDDDDDNDDDNDDDDSNNDDNDDDNDNDDNDDDNGTINKLMQGIIVKIVFSNAIKAIPNDLSLRKEFIDICRQYPDTLSIVDYIYQSLEYITDIKKTVEEYRESVKKLDSKELIYLFTEFLRRSMHKSPQETLRNYLVRLLSKSYVRAFHANVTSSQMLCEWIDWILLFPLSTDLWLRRINFGRNIQDNPLEQVYELALNHNPTSQDLWNSYVSRILCKWEINGFKNEKMEATFLPPVKKDSLFGLLSSLHHNRKIRYKDIKFERYKFSNSKRCQSASRMVLRTSLIVDRLHTHCPSFQGTPNENQVVVLYKWALEVVLGPEELKRRFRELTLSPPS
ncbi:hypothetical protein Glove_97g78 [Diversispora epigaea]|uniref:Uncharacterized protein n=1 Tax=Diversispora epigaea TaxID=1348612 RepID=A0A397J4V6_9GLOM|nr:hypothetical protein Glove_97g78 [Diversispora epigaea]